MAQGPSPSGYSTFSGLDGYARRPQARPQAGDIVAVCGVAAASIGDTIATGENPEALPTIELEPPTLSIYIGPNTSPLKGQEGEFTTSRQIAERLEKELETNIALKIEPDGFRTKFYQIFRVLNDKLFLKLFHKIETERTLPNSFYEATVMLHILPWRWNGFCLIRNLSQFPFIEDFIRDFFSTSIMFNVPNRF